MLSCYKEALMPATDPNVIIRMGSHAEKEYLDKTLRFFDGLILGAEPSGGSPGATASLLVKFGGKKANLPFFIDPMTYAFGAYVDETGKVRADLDWIKSEQKRNGRVVRDFKRSYRSLADALGPMFSGASLGRPRLHGQTSAMRRKTESAVKQSRITSYRGLPRSCLPTTN